MSAQVLEKHHSQNTGGQVVWVKVSSLDVEVQRTRYEAAVTVQW